MPRPSSDSWKYFELITTNNNNTKRARCIFCGVEKAASITRLHQHLLKRCSQITPEIRDLLRKQRDERESSRGSEQMSQNGMQMHLESSSSPMSSSIHSIPYREQQSLPSRQEGSYSYLGAEQRRSQAMLDWYLARAFFSAGISFDFIENPHMVAFLRHLQPNYVPPLGHRLQQYLLKEQHWDLIKPEEPEIIQRQQQFVTKYPIIPESLSTDTSSKEDFEGNL